MISQYVCFFAIEGSVSDVISCISESYEDFEVVKETYEHIDSDFVITEDAAITEQ